MAGRLTTHVLDTALGRPARGLSFSLARIEGDARTPLCSAVTNDDGRADNPLLQGDAFIPGVYELTFEAGDYFRAAHEPTASPLFLETIPIRFGVADAAAHYHVPLLLSPFGYSTYRGS